MLRSFRVDEDGAVIYLDEERTAQTEGLQRTLEQIRAGIMSWDDLDRQRNEAHEFIRSLGADKPVRFAQARDLDLGGHLARRGQRDERNERNLSTLPRPGSNYGTEKGEAVGLASRATRVGIEAAKARARYNPQVRQLRPDDNHLRAGLKEKIRMESPWEMRGMLDALFPDKGPRKGSKGHANKPNERVNNQARLLGHVGKGAGILGGVLAVEDIITSPDRPRAAVANVGAAIGGVLGGAGGAAAGAATGPLAVGAAPAGGVAGAVAGGKLGYDVGEGAYDYTTDLINYFRRYLYQLNRR